MEVTTYRQKCRGSPTQSLPPSTWIPEGRVRVPSRHRWLSHCRKVWSKPCFLTNLQSIHTTCSRLYFYCINVVTNQEEKLQGFNNYCILQEKDNSSSLMICHSTIIQLNQVDSIRNIKLYIFTCSKWIKEIVILMSLVGTCI